MTAVPVHDAVDHFESAGAERDQTVRTIGADFAATRESPSSLPVGGSSRGSSSCRRIGVGPEATLDEQATESSHGPSSRPLDVGNDVRLHFDLPII
jgi:hypothetical protein